MSDNSSENSASKADGNDSNAKYSRLASEYSKVRAQNSVLKKAIVEEQTKNSRLNDIIREKDQIIRKSSQENESLDFRNTQLLRRVTVLQEEIDLMNKNGKKKGKNNADLSNCIVENLLLEDDMKKTIIENAALISKLSDKEEEHEGEVAALNRQIIALNHEIDQKNYQVQQMRMEYELSIDQLRKEQEDFKRDYAIKINKLKETEIELSALKSAHQLYVCEVGPMFKKVSSLLEKKIPFGDEDNVAMNLLNVRYSRCPTNSVAFVEPLQKYFDELLLIFYNIIQNFKFELKESEFGEFKIHVKTLLNEDDVVLFRKKFNACNQLLESMRLDYNVAESVECMVNKFMRQFLDLCLALHSSYIVRQNSVQISQSYDTSSFSRTLLAFRKTVDEMFHKIVNFPNTQQDLMREEFAKLIIVLDNIVATCKNADLSQLQSNIPCLNNNRGYKSIASKYLRSLYKEKCESIPYEEAIDNKKRLQEHIMLNNTLGAEVKNLEMTLIELEKEKSYLLNECEVLRIKLANELCGLSPEIPCNLPPEETNEIGRFLPAENVSPEIVAREKEIQRHLLSKLDEAITSRELALSKCRIYMLECKALQRRLENSVVEKQLLENKYLQSNHIALELREELSTVNQNYEIQLSMMSDHLASVNEKLTLQSDEIDNLKYQLNNKMAKKSKAK